MTSWQDNAAGVATVDRQATANLILELAVHDAQQFIRAGRVGTAESVMRDAGQRAERILGRTQ